MTFKSDGKEGVVNLFISSAQRGLVVDHEDLQQEKVWMRRK
jgi:hypothetical protein